MGMGVLRWLLGSHRSKEDEDEERERAEEWTRSKRSPGRHPPNAYRIEVDGEGREMRGEGPPFSFWGSARIILILSFLLWWVQPAGPMIAGYVGGRRAGSPMKGVLAALLPVVTILIANVAYARDIASHQIDFVASLPDAFAGGVASILPFLLPYKVFLVGYLSGFVKALQSTFGMGTNGYLMVIIFAYIGGVIAEQTRRELYFKSGASQSVGLNLIQPFFGGHRPAAADEYEADDEELQELRRPTRAHARGRPVVGVSKSRRRRHGTPDRFEEYRKVGGESDEGHAARRGVRARTRDEEEEEDAEDVEVESPRTHHVPHLGAKEHRARSQGADDEEEHDEEAVARREAQEARRPKQRSHEEEVAIQRFVERALKHYEHPTR